MKRYLIPLFFLSFFFSNNAKATGTNPKAESILAYDLDRLCPRRGETLADYLAVEECICKLKLKLKSQEQQKPQAGNQTVKHNKLTAYKGKYEKRVSSVYGDPWIVQPNGQRVQYKGHAYLYEFDQHGIVARENIRVDERDYITFYSRQEPGGAWLCADLRGTTRIVNDAQRVLAPCASPQNDVASHGPVVGLIRIGGYTIVGPPAKEMRVFLTKLLTNQKLLTAELKEAASNRSNYWDRLQLSALNLSRLWASKQNQWLEAGEGSTTKASQEFEEAVKALLKRCAALHLLKQ